MNKAVVLVSGGLDSATALGIAREKGFECYALSVDYGQRHRSELTAAQNVARSLKARAHQIVPLDLTVFGGSALTDQAIAVPHAGGEREETIPMTYVPARNTIFLSLALAWAETLDCRDIFVGVNAVDYSGYPDCRPEYIQAFEHMANLATKAALDGKFLTIHAPLMHLSKKEIIQTGINLEIDFSATVSCYQADAHGRACGCCDSCAIRREGFLALGVVDPTRYR